MPVRRPNQVGAFRERAAVYRESSVVSPNGGTLAERAAVFPGVNVPCIFTQLRPDELRDLATDSDLNAVFYRMVMRGRFDFTSDVCRGLFVIWRGHGYKVRRVKQDPQARLVEMTLARDVNFDAELEERGLLTQTTKLEIILTDGRGNDLVWRRDYAAA